MELTKDPLMSIILRVRERTPMWIGEHSASMMFTFLNGYSLAIEFCTELDQSQYEQFLESLYEKYGRGGGGHSWASVLAMHTGCENAALDLFFAEAEAFCRRNV